MRKSFTTLLVALAVAAGGWLQNASAQETEKLVTVQFVTPTTGITAPAKVYLADPVTFEPTREFQADADGITYHLPDGEEVCFDVFPDEEAGYFVSQWLVDDSPIMYSSYLNSTFQKVYDGMKIEVQFEMENVFYKVEYEAPYGTMIRCVNRSAGEGEETEIQSGDMIAAASNVLFMISPETNPDGEVALKAWYINGRICVDGADDPITSNSIEFKLLEDVKVTAELDDGIGDGEEDDEPSLLPGADASAGLHCTVAAGVLTISQAEGLTTLYDLYGKQVMAFMPENGQVVVSATALPQGVYLVRDSRSCQKVLVY